jgi:hypothetical protein
MLTLRATAGFDVWKMSWPLGLLVDEGYHLINITDLHSVVRGSVTSLIEHICTIPTADTSGFSILYIVTSFSLRCRWEIMNRVECDKDGMLYIGLGIKAKAVHGVYFPL